MVNFIDISNWQRGFNVPAAGVPGAIFKATEGTGFVDSTCDGFVQAAKGAGMLWGFYHFAGDGLAGVEADYFVENCMGYFGEGIPVLDWEGNQNVAWVNAFVRRVYERTGVWPWIYANPWRFNQGGVEPNCARWVASYPAVTSPTFSQAATWDCPEADGNVVAWQFCSDGAIGGKYIDCSLFYGDEAAWKAYAKGARKQSDNAGTRYSVLENDDFKVTVEVKDNG